LESDLLLSTFADKHLESLTLEQLKQYDLFLDENDWDIYYWATQDPPDVSAVPEDPKPKAVLSQASPRPGEWAQTVGTFKAAYRPVPQRWKDSEILKMVRDHAKARKDGGMAFMPKLKILN
jgi:hypothetical protein